MGIRCHSGNLRAETAEGRIVAISDRIAYVTHDIDDAKRAGLLSEEYLPTEAREVLGNSSPERIENMVHDIVSESSRVGDIKMTDSMWGAMMTMRAFLLLICTHQETQNTKNPRHMTSSLSCLITLLTI